MASRLIPRLMAWVASVWRSWCAVTCPIPASAPRPAQRVGDAQRGDGTVAFEQEPVGAQAGGPVVGDPVVEQGLELRVEGDVAVVVELADRDAEPVGGADLDDGVDGERPELARAHPGAGQQLDDQAGERVRIRPRRPEELGGRGVVEKPWEGLVDDREVAGEHERPLGRVGVAPVGDPVEEAVQVDEAVLDADAVQRLARAQPVLGGEPGLEVLDVAAFKIGAAGDLRVVVGEPGAELAQVVLDVRHRRRPETQGDLVDVAARRPR